MRQCHIILIASFILIASSAFFAAGYSISQPKLPFSTPSHLRGDPSKIRQELLKMIPIGTSYEDARRIVASLGLEHIEPVMGSVEGLYIQCKYEGKRGLFDHTVWLIQIDCLDGKVADLFCEHMGVYNGFIDLGFF